MPILAFLFSFGFRLALHVVTCLPRPLTMYVKQITATSVQFAYVTFRLASRAPSIQDSIHHSSNVGTVTRILPGITVLKKCTTTAGTYFSSSQTEPKIRPAFSIRRNSSGSFARQCLSRPGSDLLKLYATICPSRNPAS